MKRIQLLLYATIPMFLSGCFLFEPFDSIDAVANATSDRWSVSVEMIGGKHETYEHLPEAFSGFTRKSRSENFPMLESITAISSKMTTAKYSFSAAEIARLRQASEGKVKVVLYYEGIACMPPGSKAPESPGSYTHWLQSNKQDWLKWTRGFLASRSR